MSRPVTSFLTSTAPVLFVFLWATGFVGAKYGMKDAEPFTFLAIRFALTFLLLLALTGFLYKAEFSKRHQLAHSFIAGMLIHGVYLGGVFWAIDRGLPAGLSALIVSLQPFSTVLFAFAMFGERISLQKSMSFMTALGGVILVLYPKLGSGGAAGDLFAVTILACVVGMLSISLGTVYQKRFVADLNLLVSTCLQFAGGTALVTLLALLFETGQIEWTTQVILSMAWLIFVLSIGAVCLLMYLIRNGSSNSVASLFFLVPVVAMAMAWLLFGEELALIQMVGSALVVTSVAVASRMN